MYEPYQIAEGKTIPDLMVDVASYIRRGYIPIGGVCVRPPDKYGSRYLIQALILQSVIRGAEP